MAFSKTEAVDRSAALTIEIGNWHHQLPSYDGMFGQNITGTKDCVRCKAMLDVPEDAAYIRIDVQRLGIGEVWISSMTFEEKKDEITGKKRYEDEPINPDFSEK